MGCSAIQSHLQACLAPRVQPAFDDIGLAGVTELARQTACVASGANAGAAVKDDGLSLMHSQIGFIELGEGQMAGAGNALAGVLIGLANVDQNGALIDKALGVMRRDGWQGHRFFRLVDG